MPYTPTPMLSFNYEPAKSDARRILDTQKEIKQEQQKDQEFETDMMIKQQDYELGRIKMQKAQVEADELIKQKRLDETAGQVYNSVIAAGGSKADGYKAVQEFYLREGGWAAGQKAKEEAANAWKEAWDVADINPAAAEEAAELANSMAPPGSPRMTAQSVMEAKKRIKAESQKLIKLENGDVLIPQGDGTFKVQNFLSDFTRNQLKEERDLKTKELDIRARGDALDYAARIANIAESKAARIERRDKETEEISKLQMKNKENQERLIGQFHKDYKSATMALSRGNKQDVLTALIALSASRGQQIQVPANEEDGKALLEALAKDSRQRLEESIETLASMPGGKERAEQLKKSFMIDAPAGNSNLAIPGNDDANKPILQGIIDEIEAQLAAGIDILATIPGGEKTVENMRKTLNTKPATSTGTPKKSVHDYSFMKGKGTTREYPR